MNTTYQQATHAKATLRSRLGRPDWLRGVGISRDERGHLVKVNVAEITPEVLLRIPDVLEGVRIQVEPVGEIVAHQGSLSLTGR